MTSAATISDVAKLAGVSIKTVSRVVNREANVRDKTRDTVNRAIAQLNYRPSSAARGLAGGRSFLVGLLYGNASDSFLVEIQRGILTACREYHYGLALCPANAGSPDLEKDITDWVGAAHPDGLILSPPLSDNRALVEVLVANNVKFVSVSSTGFGYGPAVHIDEAGAALQMTDHLIRAGHRKIGFIKGPADHACSLARYEGYCAALEAANLSVDDALVAEGDFHFETGVQAANKLLATPKPPSAIFASNDDMASGVMFAAHQRGLSIPQNLAVAGFDDTPRSRQFWPGLSTVKQPIEQIGQRAIERLMEEIVVAPSIQGAEKFTTSVGSAQAAYSEILPHELVLRASTQGQEDA